MAALIAFSAVVIVAAVVAAPIPGSPPDDAVSAGPSRDTTLVRPPLQNYLDAHRDDLGRALQKEKAFRGSASAPAHAESFAIYQRLVGEQIAKNGEAAVQAAWKSVADAAPEQRSGLPAFGVVLRDYTSHRYGPDVVSATQQLIRCRSYEQPGVAPAENAGFARARAVIDSLGRAGGFEISTSANGLMTALAAGAGPDTLGFWGHLDVVPPDTTGWNFDPWSAAVVDGKLQGRGAFDDKGPLAATLFAIRALEDTGVPLRSRIVLFAGLAEESSFDDINGYLAEHRAPSRNVVIDSSFPVVIGEKGATWIKVSSSFSRIPMRTCPEGYKIKELSGGVAPNQVPAYARARIWSVNKAQPGHGLFFVRGRVDNWNEENSRSQLRLRADGPDIVLEALGRAAHGSTPELGHNAIIDLVEFLYDFGTSCLNPPHHVVWFLNEFIREDLSGRGLGIAVRDSIMGRTTVNVGLVQSTPDSAFTILDIRYPRGLTSDRIVEAIRDHIGPFNQRYAAGLSVERIGGGLDPVYTEPSTPLVRNLLDAYSDVYGRTGKPVCGAGTTYAKKLPGAVAFGPTLPGEPERAHAANEYITIDELDNLTRAYATAALKLASR